MSLNIHQQQAVQLPFNQHGLIIAGAGTGKTKTLIARIIYLIQEQHILPEQIVALTFTNKAANEMKTRLEKELGLIANDVVIGTFHSFALKLIKADPEGFGLSQQFSLLNQEGQYAFVKRLFLELGWSTKNKAVDKLVDYINHLKEQGIRSGQTTSESTALLINQYKKYEKVIAQRHLVDFTDLMLLLNERLKADREYLSALRERFKVYLVDEFQDTNPIQYNTLQLLTGNISHIFAVGDDYQSIYSFRGANIKNIFDFKYLAGDNYVKLEQNYRSTKNIVASSNYLINQAEEKIEKHLWTNNEQGDPIYLYKAKNEWDEAQFVAKEIANQLRFGDKKHEDFAVLYRSNAQSEHIETALHLKQIPFRVSGGMSFFDKSDVRTLIALSRFIIDQNDGEAFVRIGQKLNIIPNADTKFLDGWIIEAEQEKIPFKTLLLRKSSLYTNITDFFKKIDICRERFFHIDLVEALTLALKDLDYFDLIGESENTLRFIEQFRLYLEAGGSSFTSFVESITRNNNLTKTQDAISLMTIHASKGLEFDQVFVLAVEDGIIPSEHAILEDNIEEERRLMYVAMTRARTRLFLIYAKQRFNGYERVEYPPSRFLGDVLYLHPINLDLSEIQQIQEQGTISEIELQTYYDKISASEKLVKIDVPTSDRKLNLDLY